MTTADLFFAIASGYVWLPLAFAVGQKRGVRSAKDEMLSRRPAPKPILTVRLPRTPVSEPPPVINPRWLFRDRPLRH